MHETEVRSLLKPLFSQFGTAADGDMETRFMGYLIALERATAPALQAAVRSYLCGEVEGHDGRFIPTSAELARVVRKEQSHLDRLAPRPRLVDARPEPSDEERTRMLARFKALSASLGSGE